MPPAGTEHQLAGMLHAAHGRHWDPTLCVLYPGDAMTREVARAGIPVITVGTGTLHPLQRTPALRRLIRSRRYDVVHTSLWGASAYARLLAAGPHRPAVVMSERRVEDFRGGWQLRLDRALRALTDEYIGNATAVAAFIRRAHRVPADRVHVVPNGIDRAIFHQAAHRRPPSAHHPLRIGAVGRLVHQKGFDVLIAALPKVLAERDVEVHIAGQGELRDELEQQAVGLPVRFVGLLDTPSGVADFLRSLDLFVMPSRYEGLPNAVLEAVACGVPIVATDAPGMRAALGAGPLVPPDDVDALAAAVIAALRDGVEPATTTIPDFDDVARAHARVFASALARRRRTSAEMDLGA
jgi:glycosyltransferase involved in cell wall biosynthesis